MSHQLGDQDQVGAAPDERGAKGVAEDVRGSLILLGGGLREGGDDIAGTADGEPIAEDRAKVLELLPVDR